MNLRYVLALCVTFGLFAAQANAQDPLYQFGGTGTADGQFREINGIALDRAGRVYVVDAGNLRIQVFDGDGTFIRAFGAPGTGDGQFEGDACGIAVNSDAERLYVSEGIPGYANHRIQVFDLAGNFQFSFGTNGTGDGEFDSPCQMAIDRSGNLYVVDNGNNRVQVFDQNGVFIRKFGEFGNADGQFNKPTGIGLHLLNDGTVGKIFVTDGFNARIQVFDAEGIFLSKFGALGAGSGDLDRPCHLAVSGMVYVADATNARVQVFDLDGISHTSIGPVGSGDSQYCSNTPLGIAADRLGRVYVEDGNVIKVFTVDRDGDGLLDVWETSGIDTDGDGVVDLALNNSPYSANPDHKDLYLEFDWRQGSEPTQAEIRAMKAAFCAAPVTAGGIANPDGKPGINLWVDTGSLTDPTGSESPARPCSCGDGIDNDGDGLADSEDPDCLTNDPTSGEGGANVRTCVDTLDNDGDGLNNLQDPDCLQIYDPTRTEGPYLRFSCSDGWDNDGDGLLDGADPDCLVGDNLGGGNELADAAGAPVLTDICDVNDPRFYAAKGDNFDSQLRKLVFRYAISGLACDQDGDGRPDIGGQGEVGGNDFIEFNHDGGTIMHELGHTLNLRHGGNNDSNCKPNYVSVMNYDNQFNIDQVWGRSIIDYAPPRFPGGRGRAPGAEGGPPQINESNLDEEMVLDATDPVNQFVFTDGTGGKMRWLLNGDFELDGTGDGDGNGVGDGIDWDGDGVLTTGGGISVNVNTSGMDGWPANCTNASVTDVLDGYNDWANISIGFRQFGDSADGAINPVLEHEPTLAELHALKRELNTTDLAIEKAVPTTPVEAGGEIGYRIRVRNQGPRMAGLVQVQDRLPPEVDFSAAPEYCELSADGTVQCEIGLMAPGQSLDIWIRGVTTRACSGGVPVPLTNTASVANTSTFAGDDPNPTDNSASVTITPVDTTGPEIQCGSPATIAPPDAPATFTASATDSCSGGVSATVQNITCYAIKNGKRIDKTGSCVVSFSGDSVLVSDSGGVDDTIQWVVRASDLSGNVSEKTCAVQVVNPN